MVLDPSTHLGAAAAGWHWRASLPEVALVALTRAVFTVLSPKGDSSPLGVLFPWNAPPVVEPISADELHDAEERLRKYTAFRD